MLSTQAFNGLLKTLEEPPPHVKFIFATTEIRKVPITILSRCQRFDLRRIDADKIVGHLGHIAGLEGVSVDDEALAMVARAAEGSMRDAQSILDQAIAHGGGTVSADAVRDMLGLADRARVVDLFEHVMKGDAAAALAEFQSQYDFGADPVAVLTDLAEFTHLVTRLRFVPSAADDASLSQVERTRGVEFAQVISLRSLSRAWQMLLKGITEVQGSNRPAMAAEMLLIRLAHASELPTLDEALKSLDGKAPQAAPDTPRTPSTPPSAPPSGPSGFAAQQRQPSAAPAAQARQMEPAPQYEPAPYAAPRAEAKPEVVVRSLGDIILLAETHRDIKFKVQVKTHVRLVRMEPGKLEVSLTDDAPKLLLNDISAKLKAWTGRNWITILSKEQGQPTLTEQENTRREDAFADARNDPTVAAILRQFQGAKIVDVRIPDAADDTALPVGDDAPAIDGIIDEQNEDET